MVDRVRLVDLSDVDLLEEHAKGNADAFGELVHRHRDRLWAVALRTLGDREEAADAVQDALVSALRANAARAPAEGASPRASESASSGAFRAEAAVTTWLHRIVVNACIDRMRRRAVRPADPLPPLDVADPRPDAMSALETSLDVTAALAQLAPDQRAALVLVDMYGWSVDAAAEVLGCATGTVKSRCARGRARLLPLLTDRAAAAGNQEATSGVPPGSAETRDPGPNRRAATAQPAKGGDFPHEHPSRP